MAKILTTITRPDCAAIRAALVAALADVELQFGLKLTTKGGKFSPNSYSLPIEFATIGEGGLANSQEAMNFKLMSRRYGVSPDALGKTIVTSHGEFYLRGLNPRSRKFPFNVERVGDNKPFRLMARTVKFALDSSAISTEHVKTALKKAMEPAIPKKGDTVRALWTDGHWYDATYLRRVGDTDFHAVKFEDGSRYHAEKVRLPSKSTDPALM